MEPQRKGRKSEFICKIVSGSCNQVTKTNTQAKKEPTFPELESAPDKEWPDNR